MEGQAGKATAPAQLPRRMAAFALHASLCSELALPSSWCTAWNNWIVSGFLVAARPSQGVRKRRSGHSHNDFWRDFYPTGRPDRFHWRICESIQLFGAIRPQSSFPEARFEARDARNGIAAWRRAGSAGVRGLRLDYLAMGRKRIRTAAGGAMGFVLVHVAVSWHANHLCVIFSKHAGHQPWNLYWRLRFAAIVSRSL